MRLTQRTAGLGAPPKAPEVFKDADVLREKEPARSSSMERPL